MVNRLLELDLLQQHLDATAEASAGHAVLILGESGVGKSRLAAELRLEARRRGLATMSAQCLGQGAEPLLPIKDALASSLGRTADHVRRSLLHAAPALLDSIPFIGAFLAKLGDTLVSGRRLRASVDGISEELSRLLLGIAEKRGLCFVVDDLHQADGDTLFFLNYFIRKIRDRKVLALFTIQLEGLREAPQLADLVARWTAEGYANLTVFPLERAHVGEYVRTLAKLGGPVDDTLVDRLFNLTGGNPFYLGETLNLLAGEGATTSGEDDLAVPPRVDAVLRRRLQRAGQETLRFLQAASVLLETTQEIEAIAHVMEATAGTAVRALADARELLLMKEGPNGEIAFVHSLMRRTVYADLGVTQRRYLHQRAAEWSEHNGQTASAAFHFERAGRVADLVRTGLKAAEQSERGGMYHSALALYQKVRPHVRIEDIGPRLAGVMITLGEWRQAREVLDLLPETDGRVRLLRSRLAFVLGDFRDAEREARTALRGPHADRTAVLAQLADIALYLGDFAEARRYAREALDGEPGPGARIPFHTLFGITAYHSGDLDEAAVQYAHALELVRRSPAGDRDVVTETMLIGNVANVAFARGDIATAERLHADALRMRREVADARGALHSLHALGRCRLALGDRAGAASLFDEADELAESLGETLERAKLTQTRSEIALGDGDGERAYDLARTALASFERSECRYDIVHGRIAVSAAAAATGRERESIALRAAARSDIARWGYTLLAMTNPSVAAPPTVADRIAGALTMYACSDALGLPYENHPPTDADDDEIQTLRATGIWSRGETSDDTALTLIAARCLVAGEGTAGDFLRRLAAASPPVKGLGPSTTAAIDRHRAGGDIPDDDAGGTNGGAMRALPCGWATPPHDTELLLRRTAELTRATHRAPEAVAAACVVAACGSWSLEGASPALLLEIARETAEAAQRAHGAAPALTAALAALADGTWRPPPEGVTMDPAETVSAALHCVLTADSAREGILAAVRLGGDADTVAALVGGLLGARMTPAQVCATLPWSGDVALPPETELTELAAGLARLRDGGT